MSFSSEQKDFIIESAYKSTCCRGALLSGIMLAKGEFSDNAVVVALEKVSYAEFLSHLAREFYGKDGEIYRESAGGRRVAVRIASKSAANFLTKMLNSGELFRQKCQNCVSAFLRGVYLAAGRASDPKSEYTLELSLGERSDIFVDFLAGLGPVASITERGGKKSVYMRDSSMIEYFYALAGMNKAMFALIDAKAEGELRKNIARTSNCMTNNMQKAVDAAGPQIRLIAELEKANLLSSLPDELEETARLRLKYPDYSLTQLTQVSVTSISKPGMSHRLKKIMEIGQQLLDRRGQTK